MYLWSNYLSALAPFPLWPYNDIPFLRIQWLFTTRHKMTHNSRFLQQKNIAENFQCGFHASIIKKEKKRKKKEEKNII